mmetsp:Transcript_21913/g.49546  ORF Transcript_21913/g.49546 Transcript_21913/m.49546 type:complete len:242 (-) Transcript_21913:87-812(-)
MSSQTRSNRSAQGEILSGPFSPARQDPAREGGRAFTLPALVARRDECEPDRGGGAQGGVAAVGRAARGPRPSVRGANGGRASKRHRPTRLRGRALRHRPKTPGHGSAAGAFRPSPVARDARGGGPGAPPRHAPPAPAMPKGRHRERQARLLRGAALRGGRGPGRVQDREQGPVARLHLGDELGCVRFGGAGPPPPPPTPDAQGHRDQRGGRGEGGLQDENVKAHLGVSPSYLQHCHLCHME